MGWTRWPRSSRGSAWSREITSAVPRLSAIAASLQVVVTSRPTPFTNSPVLPRRTFATYSLESLTRPLITAYAERWLLSRAIDDADASDVRQILNDKLDEPHLRDLARNPMQLAILLSLIHRPGVSLPDKRTGSLRQLRRNVLRPGVREGGGSQREPGPPHPDPSVLGLGTPVRGRGRHLSRHLGRDHLVHRSPALSPKTI